MEDIVDLDIIRPKARKVKLAGKVIDVSFIPCGVTFEIDDLIRQLTSLDQDKMSTDPETMKKGFDLTVELCSIFATIKNPEMTKDWFMKECSVEQMGVLSKMIQVALSDSYKGVEQYGKN